MNIAEFMRIAKPYWAKIKSLLISELLRIVALYGEDILTDISGLPTEGEGVMTQGLFLKRKSVCLDCSLRTAWNTCDPGQVIAHETEKNADGTPLMVTGCGCGLKAKQKSIKDRCPAGKW